jgi:outer membrane protein assembly factor BamB
MSEINRDPTDERDFLQFARAFDHPIAPAPSFAEALRRQVAQSAAPATVDPQPAHAPLIAGRSAAVTLADRRPRRIGFSILEIAAALLLISALALSAYVINAVGRPSTSIDTLDGQSAQLGSAATPQSLDFSAGANWGGDEGRSQYYGDASVDTAAAPIDIRIGDAETTTVGPGLVVGDSWYGWTVRAGADAFLRVNVTTGETVWERDYRTWGTLASDGQRLFAFLIDDSATPTPVPVAIDMQTGGIAWRGAALHPFATQVEFENEANAVFNLGGPPTELETYYVDLTSEDHGPVVIGDTVYFTDGMATTVALNTSDGSERWRYDRSANFAGYSDKIGTPAVGTIVANERYLFVMLPDWSIVSLDPNTGRELGRSFRGGFVVSTRHVVGMNLLGDRLIVFTASSFVDTNSSIVVPDGPGGLFGAVSVLDARTLDVLVTSDFIEGGIIHEAVVTSTSAFVLSYSERGERELVEVDLVTGALSEPFGTGLLGRSVRLSGSGDTLVAAVPSGSVHVFSMETHELLDQHGLGLTESPTLVGGPVPVVDGRPVVIWKAGPNDPVPQMPEATPIP